MGCEGSPDPLMTSTPRYSNSYTIAPHAITLSDHEDVKVYDGACNNTLFTQKSAEERKSADKDVLPNNVPVVEEEICFGMVLPRMQMMTVKAPRRLTHLQTDLRRESSRVKSVSA